MTTKFVPIEDLVDLQLALKKAERELATTRKAHAVTAEKQMHTATALQDAERERDEALAELEGLRESIGEDPLPYRVMAVTQMRRSLSAEATITRVKALASNGASGWRGRSGWLFMAGVTADAEPRAEQLKECADELLAALEGVEAK